MRPIQTKTRDNAQPFLQSSQTNNLEERYTTLRLLKDTTYIVPQSLHNFQDQKKYNTVPLFIFFKKLHHMETTDMRKQKVSL